MPGSGAADNAAAQIQADALRNNPGTTTRWDGRMWLWLAVASVPLIAAIVASILVQ